MRSEFNRKECIYAVEFRGAILKVIILAGGLGTRLTEETEIKPKPMVEIGGRPILWHIMKHYAHYGFHEFIVALGYKGEVIKRYFLDYYALSSNVLTVNLANGNVKIHRKECEDWTIHLVETGLQSMTGGRLRYLSDWIGHEPFMLTYGDGVSNINLTNLVQFHKDHGHLATVSAVRPPARFGGIHINGNYVVHFTEKPQTGEGWINGGYMVLEPQILQRIKGDETSLESDVLEELSKEGNLVAYPHDGFWQCMDTLRDKKLLESFWEERRAPWKVWA